MMRGVHSKLTNMQARAESHRRERPSSSGLSM